MNKIALITGANKGIGLETARQLARDYGFTVLIGARDEARGTQAADELKTAGLDARFLSLDVTQQASIDAAAKRIEAEFGHLDVLINNAGVGFSTTAPSQETLEIVRATFEVNVFGTFAVTRAMLPLLCQAQAGRIVNMSSNLGSLARSGDPNFGVPGMNPFAYSASKTANNAITMSFAKDLAGTTVKINAIEPGYTATDLTGFHGTTPVEEAARQSVRMALVDENGPNGGFFDKDGTVPW